MDEVTKLVEFNSKATIYNLVDGVISTPPWYMGLCIRGLL